MQPSFYIKIGRQLQIFPDLPISTIREEFEHVSPVSAAPDDHLHHLHHLYLLHLYLLHLPASPPQGFNVETATARRGSGLGHPGHDCWTFPKDWVPRIILGFTMVGVSMVATDLMQALHAISGCRMSLLTPALTFHFVEGDSVVRHPGNQRARNNNIFTGLYTAWNCAQFARNKRDVLAVHPDYEQCWFAQQAEWSSYSYQCAQSADQHLPHEFKLLYHNETIDHPHLSNCNLPSLCAKCRTRDGLQRPVADLMASIPCGFCRCGSDLHHPPYITLPKEVSWSSRESLDVALYQEPSK